MSIHIFTKTTRIERPAEEVFAWHEREGTFERLIPPWEKVEVLSRDGAVRNGARAAVRTKVGPWWVRWEAEHRDYVEGRQFRDVLQRGPFSFWEHTHRFELEGAAACCLTDEVKYQLPLGGFGQALGGTMVRDRLQRMFAYRHAVTAEDLRTAERYGAVRKLRILVAGASGLVGRALVPFLQSQGHSVARLVRRPASGAEEFFWAPERGELDLTHFRGVDAVINLAGENVGEGRWTEERRAAILQSRVSTTKTLVKAIGELKYRPFVFVNASAIGYYGSHPTEIRDEGSPQGSGYLAEVCGEWENEALSAAGFGVRTAVLRTGVVLTPAGGMLGRVLPIFRAGLGGTIGSSRAGFSWISVDDAVAAYYHALLDQRCSGAVNAAAPEPVAMEEFARILGRVVRRPAFVPVPSWAVCLAFGNERAHETVLSSAWVRPAKLLAAGFEFRHERLETALRHLLGVPRVRQRG